MWRSEDEELADAWLETADWQTTSGSGWWTAGGSGSGVQNSEWTVSVKFGERFQTEKPKNRK